jgi:hypothetical protein
MRNLSVSQVYRLYQEKHAGDDDEFANNTAALTMCVMVRVQAYPCRLWCHEYAPASTQNRYRQPAMKLLHRDAIPCCTWLNHT